MRARLIPLGFILLCVPHATALPPEEPAVAIIVPPALGELHEREVLSTKITVAWSCSQTEVTGAFLSGFMRVDVNADAGSISAHAEPFEVRRVTPDKCKDDAFVYWGNSTLRLQMGPLVPAFQPLPVNVHVNLTVWGSSSFDQSRWGPFSARTNVTASYVADVILHAIDGGRLVYSDEMRCGNFLLEAASRSNAATTLRLAPSGPFPLDPANVSLPWAPRQMHSAMQFPFPACVPIDHPREPDGTLLQLQTFVSAVGQSGTERPGPTLLLTAIHQEYAASTTPAAGWAMGALGVMALAAWRRTQRP